jgi:hypothetical protein
LCGWVARAAELFSQCMSQPGALAFLMDQWAGLLEAQAASRGVQGAPTASMGRAGAAGAAPMPLVCTHMLEWLADKVNVSAILQGLLLRTACWRVLSGACLRVHVRVCRCLCRTCSRRLSLCPCLAKQHPSRSRALARRHPPLLSTSPWTTTSCRCVQAGRTPGAAVTGRAQPLLLHVHRATLAAHHRLSCGSTWTAGSRQPTSTSCRWCWPRTAARGAHTRQCRHHTGLVRASGPWCACVRVCVCACVCVWGGGMGGAADPWYTRCARRTQVAAGVAAVGNAHAGCRDTGACVTAAAVQRVRDRRPAGLPTGAACTQHDRGRQVRREGQTACDLSHICCFVTAACAIRWLVLSRTQLGRPAAAVQGVCAGGPAARCVLPARGRDRVCALHQRTGKRAHALRQCQHAGRVRCVARLCVHALGVFSCKPWLPPCPSMLRRLSACCAACLWLLSIPPGWSL